MRKCIDNYLFIYLMLLKLRPIMILRICKDICYPDIKVKLSRYSFFFFKLIWLRLILLAESGPIVLFFKSRHIWEQKAKLWKFNTKICNWWKALYFGASITIVPYPYIALSLWCNSSKEANGLINTYIQTSFATGQQTTKSFEPN